MCRPSSFRETGLILMVDGCWGLEKTCTVSAGWLSCLICHDSTVELHRKSMVLKRFPMFHFCARNMLVNVGYNTKQDHLARVCGTCMPSSDHLVPCLVAGTSPVVRVRRLRRCLALRGDAVYCPWMRQTYLQDLQV